MKTIRSNQKEWLENKGYSKKILLDDENLKSGSLVQEIKIKAGEKAGEHYHQKQTEVFYFLNNLFTFAKLIQSYEESFSISFFIQCD